MVCRYGVLKNSSGDWEEFVGTFVGNGNAAAIIMLGTFQDPALLESEVFLSGAEIVEGKIEDRPFRAAKAVKLRSSTARRVSDLVDAARDLTPGIFTLEVASDLLGRKLELREQVEADPDLPGGVKSAALPEVEDGDPAIVFSDAIKAYVVKISTPRHNGDTLSLFWLGLGRIRVKKNGVESSLLTEKATKANGRVVFDWELK